ncbi:MAG: anaerobic ribonucleoside-triphosphate reductase activating protein [Bacilli bacterium]
MAKYNKIYTCDMANGEGVRVVVFFSGCSHGCKGCYNAYTWNPKNGYEVTDEVIEGIIDSCANHTGLSLSGGDPLYRGNRLSVLNLVRRFKLRYPEKDIWMWTGYTFEDIKDDEVISEILKHVDVVIDGKYEQDNPTMKPWRGSNNQRKIDIKTLTID